ncbi:hypothetical protein SAMN05660657_05018 [Geodermatophilus amargosae]|uniref:Uncharacterized protein n=1 Tax=Geodermatophilus amargosae TaxID=1296565 RepID=A0A1I7CXQ7_9ACTN|nr:hypothetical protein SAMN05660657_05018 [Geodermatophilus amargosae]
MWAGVLAAAALGLALWLVPTVVGESSRSSPSARSAQSTEAASLPSLPATARMPDEQLRATIVDLGDLVQGDPDAAGPETDEVLDNLRQVEVLGGGEQRSAAVVAHDAVGAAVADGGLAAAVGQQVQEVLAGVARPERLIDLVQTVGADPPAIGPAGPGLHDPLIALDHQVPADQTADRAAALLEDVRNAAEQGELSKAFADAALPTLQELADPGPHRALQDLLADAEQDPGAIGPASEEVLTSLRAIAELPVWPQGNEVAALLDLVRQDGQVTPTFREAVIPVLVPLAR